MSKTLIHTALLCEAQTLIDFYHLKQDSSIQNKTFKIFTNNEIIILVSGIGKSNTTDALHYVFKNFEVNKAINIGIAGCSDSSIKIGTLFCTNRLLPRINFANITTVDEPLESDEDLETLLVDMEAQYFLTACKEYINNITILKVVSDYLDTQIPKKSFVIELIRNSFTQWKSII